MARYTIALNIFRTITYAYWKLLSAKMYIIRSTHVLELKSTMLMLHTKLNFVIKSCSVKWYTVSTYPEMIAITLSSRPEMYACLYSSTIKPLWESSITIPSFDKKVIILCWHIAVLGWNIMPMAVSFYNELESILVVFIWKVSVYEVDIRYHVTFFRDFTSLILL